MSKMRKIMEALIPDEGGFSSENPLSLYDRLKYDWKGYREMHPDYMVKLDLKEEPYKVVVINMDSGEVVELEAVDYDNVSIITYKDGDKEISSEDIDDYIESEFADYYE